MNIDSILLKLKFVGKLRVAALLNFSDDESYINELDDENEPLCATEEVMYELDLLDTLISNNIEYLSSHFE